MNEGEKIEYVRMLEDAILEIAASNGGKSTPAIAKWANKHVTLITSLREIRRDERAAR